MLAIQEDFVAVPLSIGIYRQLLERCPHPNAVIQDVIQDFLDRTADDIPPLKKNRGSGLHWEVAFLPEKTRIRTKHHGQYKYAEIKGDYVIYEGETFSSVAAAINRMRGNTQNNAWKVTQVMRPTDSEWVGAFRIRRQGGL
ncbi:MAG: hypothetical protein M0017_03505 [Desulfobacteraceae bacterium]|nr:hypothetical protein [Desulfobacteraceae bacterium]